MSWNAQVSFQSRLFAGKGGGGQGRLVPPGPRKPCSSRRWMSLRTTCVSEATVRLEKETSGAPKRGGSPGLCHPSLPGPCAFLLSVPPLQVSSVLFRILLGLFSPEGVFLTRPGCLPTSTVNCLVRERREHSAPRGPRGGEARLPRGFRIAVTRKG